MSDYLEVILTALAVSFAVIAIEMAFAGFWLGVCLLLPACLLFGFLSYCAVRQHIVNHRRDAK